MKPNHFDDLLEDTTRHLTMAFRSASSPVPLFKSTGIDRCLNHFIIRDLEKMVHAVGESIDGILDDYFYCDAEKIKTLQEKYFQSSGVSHLLARTLAKVQFRRYDLNEAMYFLDGLKEKLTGFLKEYAIDISEYHIHSQWHKFSPNAVSRAAADVLAMRVFAEVEEQDCPPKNAMYAIALLHPLADDFIDSGKDAREMSTGILRALDGLTPSSDDFHLNLIYRLINEILREYPPDTHPLLVHILKVLHVEQCRSLNQKREPTEDEILHISFRKGALALLSAAYISLGSLDSEGVRCFIQHGSLYQLIDDLRDTQEDLESGIATVWTHAIKSGKSLDDDFGRLVGLHIFVESDLNRVSLIESNPGRLKALKALHKIGTKTLLAIGYFANRGRFETRNQEVVERGLPVRIDLFQRILKGVDSHLQGEDARVYFENLFRKQKGTKRSSPTFVSYTKK